MTNNSVSVVHTNQNESAWTPAQIELLKKTVAKNSTDDEFKVFCYAVQRTGLDPFMKQIHLVKRRNNKTNKEDMSIQVGIDGFRVIAHRTGSYAGNDRIIFDDEIEPNIATITVYKLVQGMRCAFTATVRWSEYYPGQSQGFMWDKMPCVMLGKVAESVALRMAFPAELSGLYSDEEMAQADKPQNEKMLPGPQAREQVNQHTQIVGVVNKSKAGQALTTSTALTNPLLVAKTEEWKKVIAVCSRHRVSVDDYNALLAKNFPDYPTDRGKLTVEQMQKIGTMLEAEYSGGDAADEPITWENETLDLGPIGS